jgi:hypothetical protein
VIKLKQSSQLIGQFGHVTASAVCKQPVEQSWGYLVLKSAAILALSLPANEILN